jgi:hypothetical protein
MDLLKNSNGNSSTPEQRFLTLLERWLCRALPLNVNLNCRWMLQGQHRYIWPSKYDLFLSP